MILSSANCNRTVRRLADRLTLAFNYSSRLVYTTSYTSHCSCACGKEEAYKYTDSYVLAQLKDAKPSARPAEAPSAQAMHASTEDLKAEAEAAEVV